MKNVFGYIEQKYQEKIWIEDIRNKTGELKICQPLFEIYLLLRVGRMRS